MSRIQSNSVGYARSTPQQNRDLFDRKSNFAIKVIDPYATKHLLESKIKDNDYLWVTPGFMKDSEKEIVRESKRIPALTSGDWVVMEGATMRLVSKDHPDNERLEKKLNNVPAEPKTNDSQWIVLDLPQEYFPNSYARTAGAATRQIERFPSLQAVFDRFFDVTSPEIRTISVSLHGRKTKTYDEFQLATLNSVPLTRDDLELISGGLGIEIKTNGIPSTIADVVPFKKVLEALTCYNPQSKIPMLVSFNISKKTYKFLLSPDDKQANQLIVSRMTSSESGNDTFIGHAYPYWVGNSNYAPTAQDAAAAIDNPISKIKSMSQNLIEFLACTHIVEPHFTPGELKSSRVPGSAKLARAVVREADAKQLPLKNIFASEDKTPYPMAGKGGTGNTRNAVNSLRRDGGARSANVSDSDMSDESCTSGDDS